MKEETNDIFKGEILNELENKPIECYELFLDDDEQKYFPQYKNGRARDIWRVYASAFCAMFTGHGLYGNNKTNSLHWTERIAAIVFNLINFGGLASLMLGATNLLLPVFGISNLSYLVFGFINLSPFLLVVGGVLVLTGFYLAWQGSKIAKESRRIYIETQIQENQKWLLVSKDAENINLVPVQSNNKLISNGIKFEDIEDPKFSFNKN